MPLTVGTLAWAPHRPRPATADECKMCQNAQTLNVTSCDEGTRVRQWGVVDGLQEGSQDCGGSGWEVGEHKRVSESLRHVLEFTLICPPIKVSTIFDSTEKGLREHGRDAKRKHGARTSVSLSYSPSSSPLSVSSLPDDPDSVSPSSSSSTGFSGWSSACNAMRQPRVCCQPRMVRHPVLLQGCPSPYLVRHFSTKSGLRDCVTPNDRVLFCHPLSRCVTAVGTTLSQHSQLSVSRTRITWVDPQ